MNLACVMNPVLSSTIDFDQYINDVLNTKPVRSSSATRSGNMSSSRPTSINDAKTSSNMMELNSKKFSLNKRPTSNTGSSQLKPSEGILDALNMTHSWKGHLSSTYTKGANRYADNGVSDVQDGIASLNVNLPTPSRRPNNATKFAVDEDADEPLPNPPLAYSKQQMSPARPSVATTSSGYSPARSVSRSVVDDDVAAATDTLEQYRRRTKNELLVKYFRNWQIETKLSKGLLQTRSKIVARNVASSEWLLRTVLRDWKNLYRAVTFTEVR